MSPLYIHPRKSNNRAARSNYNSLMRRLPTCNRKESLERNDHQQWVLFYYVLGVWNSRQGECQVRWHTNRKKQIFQELPAVHLYCCNSLLYFLHSLPRAAFHFPSRTARDVTVMTNYCVHLYEIVWNDQVREQGERESNYISSGTMDECSPS